MRSFLYDSFFYNGGIMDGLFKVIMMKEGERSGIFKEFFIIVYALV